MPSWECRNAFRGEHLDASAVPWPQEVSPDRRALAKLIPKPQAELVELQSWASFIRRGGPGRDLKINPKRNVLCCCSSQLLLKSQARLGQEDPVSFPKPAPSAQLTSLGPPSITTLGADHCC